MKVSDYIEVTIDRFPKGYVFTYADFNPSVKQKEAIIKALNRLADSGKLVKLARGKYYKPEDTPFGILQPSQEQVVKDLLENDNKTTGYLTGISIYNKLGLTTQVGNTIQIARNNTRPSFKRERYTISFIKQNNTITNDNIPLLQILDAIRYIRRIPDTTVASSCRRLLSIIKELTDEEKNSLARLARKYPPSTRALLGAMLDQLQHENISSALLKTLNPITQYKLPEVSGVLSTTQKWNIV